MCTWSPISGGTLPNMWQIEYMLGHASQWDTGFLESNHSRMLEANTLLISAGWKTSGFFALFMFSQCIELLNYIYLQSEARLVIDPVYLLIHLILLKLNYLNNGLWTIQIILMNIFFPRMSYFGFPFYLVYYYFFLVKSDNLDPLWYQILVLQHFPLNINIVLDS